MEDEIKDFRFYTEEEILKLSSDLRLAQKRTNKVMQISRLHNATKAILRKMGYEDDKHLRTAELKGEVFESSLYDAYLVAKYELDAAQKRLQQMPTVSKLVDIMFLFWYEVQNEDPLFWKEMKERAGARAAKINQAYTQTQSNLEREEGE